MKYERSSEAAPRVLDIECIEVASSYLEVRIRVPVVKYRLTSEAPGLADRLFGVFPGLARHTCVNGTRHGFRREAEATETAHLFEHVACEIMALAGSPRGLRAATAWDFSQDGDGVYRVTLEFDDDLVAIASVKEAGAVIEWLFGGDALAAPDATAIAARVSSLRDR